MNEGGYGGGGETKKYPSDPSMTVPLQCCCLLIDIVFVVWGWVIGKHIRDMPGVTNFPTCEAQSLANYFIWGAIILLVAVASSLLSSVIACVCGFVDKSGAIGGLLQLIPGCAAIACMVAAFVFWILIQVKAWGGCQHHSFLTKYWGNIQAWLIYTYVIFGIFPILCCVMCACGIGLVALKKMIIPDREGYRPQF